jgi:hypothetical protein
LYIIACNLTTGWWPTFTHENQIKKKKKKHTII